MSKLIYCENRTEYKTIDKSLLWDNYITDNLEECIKYISLYAPCSITVSDKKLDDFSEIVKCINSEYKNFPSIFIYPHKKIISSITDEYEKRKILKADKIPPEIDKLINSALLKHGFFAKLKGYTYIKRALYEGIINEGAYINIKKILYPNIATMYLVSEASVERSITASIQKAYFENEELKKLFGYSDKAPSNLTFLKRFLILLNENLSS